MGISNWPADERPREKMLLRGCAGLSDSELLAVLLGLLAYLLLLGRREPAHVLDRKDVVRVDPDLGLVVDQCDLVDEIGRAHV